MNDNESFPRLMLHQIQSVLNTSNVNDFQKTRSLIAQTHNTMHPKSNPFQFKSNYNHWIPTEIIA